ncbi:hypothetical protein ACNOYE_25970 [Nannocystaceae bacterium ST9]
MHDDELLELGALRSDDTDDHDPDEAHDGDDLALHLPPSDEPAEAIRRPEDAWIDMGNRPIARSAEGLTVVNTLEVLPPFEFSV